MVVYSLYPYDARVKRAAETIASLSKFRVTVICLKEGERPKSYRSNSVDVREINVQKYNGNGLFKHLASYINFLFQSFYTCSRLLFGDGVDIVHVHNMPNFIVLSALLPKLLGKRVILDIHDTMIETYSAKFNGGINGLLIQTLKLEESLSCLFADKIICVNDIQRQALVTRGIPDNKITTILNIPDTRIFNYAKVAATNNRDGKFKIIYHGTITKRLGVDLAIRAVVDLKEKIPEIEFTIFGYGDGLSEYIALSRDLNADDFIKFPGTVPLEQLEDVLGEMDLGIVPNRRNKASELMLPVKLLEYIAVGIPVVVPTLKCIKHYFTKNMVFFFEPDETDSLKEVILDAYSEKEKRIRKAQEAKWFLKEYGWNKHRNILINLFRDL